MSEYGYDVPHPTLTRARGRARRRWAGVANQVAFISGTHGIGTYPMVIRGSVRTIHYNHF